MSEFLSFLGVIALWVAVSALAWLVHQRRNGSRQGQRIGLARAAADKVAEAQAVFDHIRRDLPKGVPLGNLSAQTHALLKRIQQHGEFFDAVSGLRPQLTRMFGEECEPLAEMLHIRRDLWAASEIVLNEDFHKLGPDFADEEAYARLREEAVHVLLPAAAKVLAPHDIIDLRLSLARDEARQFVTDTEEAVRLAREHERLPTASELIAYPVAAARAVPGQVRSARDQSVSFYRQVRAIVVMIRQSESVVKGLGELRRARAELPQRVVAGLGRTSAAARQSATSLKGHYDFLVTAYDFQAKYEELVRKAPELTERGKQFIGRLELAEKSERLKLTSATLRDWGKRTALWSLANAIAALQRLLTALENRLASANAAVEGAAASTRTRRSVGPVKAGKAAPVRKGSAPNGAHGAAAASSRGGPGVSAQAAPGPVAQQMANTVPGERGPALGTMHRQKRAPTREPGAQAPANPLPRLTLKGLAANDGMSAPASAPIQPAQATQAANSAPLKARAAATPAGANRPLKLQETPPAPQAIPAATGRPRQGADNRAAAQDAVQPGHPNAGHSKAAAQAKTTTQSQAASVTGAKVIAPPPRKRGGWWPFGKRAKPKAAPSSALRTVYPSKAAKEQALKEAERNAAPMPARSEGQAPRSAKAQSDAAAPPPKPSAPAKRSWFGWASTPAPKRTRKPAGRSAVAPPVKAEEPPVRDTRVAAKAAPAMPERAKHGKRDLAIGGAGAAKSEARARPAGSGAANPPPLTAPASHSSAAPSRPVLRDEADKAAARPASGGNAVPGQLPSSEKKSGRGGWFGRSRPSAVVPPARSPADEEARPEPPRMSATPSPAAAAAPPLEKHGAAEPDKAPRKRSLYQTLSRGRTQAADGENATNMAAPAKPTAQPQTSLGSRAMSEAAKAQATPDPDRQLAPPLPAPSSQSAAAKKSRVWSQRSYHYLDDMPAPAKPAMPPSEPSEVLAGDARKDMKAQGETFKLPPLKLIVEAGADPVDSDAESVAKAPEPVPDATKPAASVGQKAASLAAKLSAATADPDGEEPEMGDEPELANETEDDDDGPLTQTILESRDRAFEEPGPGLSRAFPWLRR